MSVAALSRETIQEMNLAAMRVAAQDISVFVDGIGIPEEDLELFFQHVEGERVLDAGCGWGRYADRFPKAGLDYTGVDRSPELLVIAKEAHPDLTFRAMDFMQLDFPDNTFDGIWGCCVLGGEPKACVPAIINEMIRVLKNGGLLYVIIPSANVSEEAVIDSHLGAMFISLWQPTEFAEMLMGNQQVANVELILRPADGSASYIIKKR